MISLSFCNISKQNNVKNLYILGFAHDIDIDIHVMSKSIPVFLVIFRGIFFFNQNKELKKKIYRFYYVDMHSRLCLNWNATQYLSLILTGHMVNFHCRYTYRYADMNIVQRNI